MSGKRAKRCFSLCRRLSWRGKKVAHATGHDNSPVENRCGKTARKTRSWSHLPLVFRLYRPPPVFNACPLGTCPRFNRGSRYHPLFVPRKDEIHILRRRGRSFARRIIKSSFQCAHSPRHMTGRTGDASVIERISEINRDKSAETRPSRRYSSEKCATECGASWKGRWLRGVRSLMRS